MSQEACCTCAALLSSIPPQYNEKTEKPAIHERRLDCCGRAICARCMTDNPRFISYCPFCQVSSQPSILPQGLREPPAYSPPEGDETLHNDEPPPYSANGRNDSPMEKNERQGEDVLHFVDSVNDTIGTLAVRYGVPASALRRTNGLFADHLLAARRTILIPGEFYKGGVSLSPRPIEGEEEELRKSKLRKWMVACKVSEYEVAELYLKQAEYDLDMAVEAYKADECWEKEHPLAATKGKGRAETSMKKRRGFGLTGQIG